MEKPAHREVTDKNITQALLLVEGTYKDRNGGLSTFEKEIKTAEERRRDGLWISRQARHNGELYDEDNRTDGRTLPINGLLPGDINHSVEVMEYLRDIRIPYVPVRADASVDAHVSVTQRINKCYERKLLFPHAKFAKTYHHDRNAPHPFFFAERIDGADYKDTWGEKAQPVPTTEISGIGCIGWSFRQRRRFVRKMALIRIMFLFFRSTRIRGAGDNVPIFQTPHEREMYLEFFQAAKTENWSNFASHQEAHPKSRPKFFGPWREAREMVEQLARRHDVFQKGFFRKKFPDADTEIAAATEAFTNAVQAVLNDLHLIRENENELDPDRPFVLDHGALNGAWNIIVKETAVVGVTDFANAAYVPYSKAVSDLTNQTPSYEESFDSNAHDVYFVLSKERFAALGSDTKPVSLTMSEAQKRPWSERSKTNYKGRRFDLANTKELKQRWGEITWEDLVHGDRFEDHHASNEIYSETPSIVFRKKQKAWQRSGNMPSPRGDYDVHRVLPRQAAGEANEIRTAWIANTWFVEPVLFLVDQFVKSYLKEGDLMGLWQDPLVNEVAGCKRGKGPVYFGEMARKLADETHKAKKTASP